SLAPGIKPSGGPLVDLLQALPAAALAAARTFGNLHGALPPALLRALRDTVASESLARLPVLGDGGCVPGPLVADIVEFLVELGGSRVEAQDLTHGVLVTDVLRDVPRLRIDYPADLRSVKRAPLLFDGRRSILVVDSRGRARTELQRHHVERLGLVGPRKSSPVPLQSDAASPHRALHSSGRLASGSAPDVIPLDATALEFTDSGSLVAEATRRLGGLGFFLRGDRTIWAFADGRPLLLRRAARWTAFPLELATAIDAVLGGSAAAGIVVQAAFLVSAQRHGAILAIVEDPAALDGVVPAKDRWDRRNDVDPLAVLPEVRLHHLIDAATLDALTLARLAALDGATIVDRNGRLLAYAAIVPSADSRNEGARTAAAKTLSTSAAIVLKVSVDGDITVFRDGEVVVTLLG
ncbi:MAG: DNA integrity scanning protein DisA nucleotide-binding domain protein, partial [Acidimicrobiia bacterium]|nr:DNA integrity scanning protein DisA nucleotide-binding domain protein [Acidimicrobiia bacterium]